MNNTIETTKENYRSCPRYEEVKEIGRKKKPGHEFLIHKGSGWDIPYELALKYEHMYPYTMLSFSERCGRRDLT